MIKYTDRFSENLKMLRKYKNLSQEKLADELNLSRSLIGMWESGQRKPSFETLELLADFFNIRLDDLSGRNINNSENKFNNVSNIIPFPKTSKKPRLGVIACGEPILAEENIEDYDDVPDNMKCDFTLLCEGDSMINARIYDGDIVYIREQPQVENGEIAACLVEGEFETKATLKRFYKYDDKIVLQSENPKYQPFVYVNEEMNKVRVIGKAVGFTSKL